MAENNATNTPAPANGGAVAPKVNEKTLELKKILNADSVQEQFKNALGKNASTFVASVIDLYNSDSKLRECNPTQVVMEALKAAVLHPPINRSLGFAYIIPFNIPAGHQFFTHLTKAFVWIERALVHAQRIVLFCQRILWSQSPSLLL